SGFYVRFYLAGVAVCGLRYRCLCKTDRRLARLQQHDNGLRPGRSGASCLRPPPQSVRRPYSSFGSRVARRIQPVVATPLIMEVFYGTTSGVDAEVDRARGDALTRCAVTSV